MREDKNEREPMQSIPQRKPIICPVCGSREIAITAEYHKCIWLQLIAKALLMAMIISAVVQLNKLIAGDFDFIIIIFLASIYLVLLMIIYVTESKTHSKAICRDCGHIWLID